MKTGPTRAFAPHLMTSAILLRLGLFIFSVWQDETRWPDGQLRFTDVDYDVFTRAARAMVAGRDIYEASPTYRYSPIIALLLAPGHYAMALFNLSSGYYFIAYAFGKVVFVTADILCAIVLREIILVERTKNPDNRSRAHSVSWLVGIFWLFNPITAAVSVRGNAESVLGLCVLACLLCLLKGRVALSGVLFGVCIHLKLYPIIYAPVIYLYLCEGDPLTWVTLLLPNRRHWLFGFATLSSLLGLTWAGYAVYGWVFLHQAYFYHFTRVDFWHNFAPHFYPIYLFEGVLALNETAYDVDLFPYNHFPVWLLDTFYQPATLRQIYSVFKILIMLPSVVLVTALSFQLRHRLSFAWFAVTFVFVSFNKVCTSQYFLWWLVLLPAALAHVESTQKHSKAKGLLAALASKLGLSPTAIRRFVGLASLWLGSQGCWLSMAYLHEMQGGRFWGRGLWLALWAASLLFLAANILILKKLMQWVDTDASRRPGKKRLDDAQTHKIVGAVERQKEEVEGVIRKRRVLATSND
uniref:GPI alpha-1,4-mannosyltransferase I, catalytic subunit n=1 Tax=Mesocestoides corti TaxID=53468 RepID=A0A5K3EQ19_MESCO